MSFVKSTDGFSLLAAMGLLFCAFGTAVPAPRAEVSVDWNKTIALSKTNATMLVESSPLLRPGAPIHATALAAIKALSARYVRYHLWYPYPRLAVPELEPPTPEKTAWDFSLIDPGVIEFLNVTRGQEPILNFSTIPAWMFKTSEPVRYPQDPDQTTWTYTPYTAPLIDPSGQQVADYISRIVSWYTQGGFTDEHGQYHRSGHHYALPWWGVLNEIDWMGPQQYTILYDAIVSAVRKVSPQTKFVGLELANTSLGTATDPAFFEYFLDAKHHRAGIPLDMIAYHFYAFPSRGETLEHWQYTMFHQADWFIGTVRYIESIRKRLSPATRVDVGEIGGTLEDVAEMEAGAVGRPATESIPPAYWNLTGALYAYLYVELAKEGVDVAAASQINADPYNYPSVALLNWKTGAPNARFRVLELIRDNFGPGDRLVATESRLAGAADIMAQGIVTTHGRKLLLVNKRMKSIEVSLKDVGRVGNVAVIDVETGESPPRSRELVGEILHLKPFAVSVLKIG